MLAARFKHGNVHAFGSRDGSFALPRLAGPLGGPGLLHYKFTSAKPAALVVTNSSKQIEVVAGLIFRDGRVLACQRREDAAFPLKWEFPGGKIESGENAAEALRREINEELAIDVLKSAEVYRHEHFYPGGPRVHLRFFRILQYSGEVENRVFQQIAWVELSELPDLDFLDGDKPLIDKLATPQGAKILLL